MKIIAIGVGSAMSDTLYHSSFLLEEENRRMLVDCGFRVPAALYDRGIAVKSINDIYVSHAHADHVGGLEYIAFQTFDWAGRAQYWMSRKDPNSAPRLYANGTLMTELWEKTLRGGLESLEGIDANLTTYFATQPIAPNATFDWCGWTCRPVQQVHIMTGSIITNTFGLIMSKLGHKTVYFTSDSQHCSPKQMEVFYKQADIIFQDAEFIGVDPDKKTVAFMSGVHANYAQLAGYPSANSTVLPKEIKEKMVLTHYQDFVARGQNYLGCRARWPAILEEDGFKGLCCIGAEYEV